MSFNSLFHDTILDIITRDSLRSAITFLSFNPEYRMLIDNEDFTTKLADRYNMPPPLSVAQQMLDFDSMDIMDKLRLMIKHNSLRHLERFAKENNNIKISIDDSSLKYADTRTIIFLWDNGFIDHTSDGYEGMIEILIKGNDDNSNMFLPLLIKKIITLKHDDESYLLQRIIDKALLLPNYSTLFQVLELTEDITDYDLSGIWESIDPIIFSIIKDLFSKGLMFEQYVYYGNDLAVKLLLDDPVVLEDLREQGLIKESFEIEVQYSDELDTVDVLSNYLSEEELNEYSLMFNHKLGVMDIIDKRLGRSSLLSAIRDDDLERMKDILTRMTVTESTLLESIDYDISGEAFKLLLEHSEGVSVESKKYIREKRPELADLLV